jgi:hypothetical protein
MSTLGLFLAAAAGPIAKRVLTSLGIGVVSFVGLDLAVGGALESARTAWSGLPSDVAAYLAVAGVGQALAIVCGGITARVAVITLKRLALL